MTTIIDTIIIIKKPYLGKFLKNSLIRYKYAYKYRHINRKTILFKVGLNILGGYMANEKGYDEDVKKMNIVLGFSGVLMTGGMVTVLSLMSKPMDHISVVLVGLGCMIFGTFAVVVAAVLFVEIMTKVILEYLENKFKNSNPNNGTIG